MGHIAHKTNSSNQRTHLRKAMITITLLKIEKKPLHVSLIFILELNGPYL